VAGTRAAEFLAAGHGAATQKPRTAGPRPAGWFSGRPGGPCTGCCSVTARRRARGQHPPVRWAWACRVQFPQVAALLPHEGAMLACGSAAAVRWRLAVGGV